MGYHCTHFQFPFYWCS